MTSKIVVNNIESDSGISSITLNSNITGEDSTQNISGINSVTANAFYGSGANLTGVGHSFGNSSVNSTGIATFSQVETLDGTSFLKKHSVGIGTTTTAGRNAGVGTAIGEMVYNSSDLKLQIYNGTQWLNLTAPMAATGGTTSSSGGFKYHQFNSSGTFTVTSPGNIDAIIVAGGGGGGGGQQSGGNGTGLHGGGGGAGGVVTLTNTYLSSGSYAVVIGDGGGTYQNGNNSTFNGSTAIAGGRGGSEGSGKSNGASGGSGGGGAGASSGGTNGTANTGGGGGGSDRPNNGGSGGKGVVIIRYEE